MTTPTTGDEAAVRAALEQYAANLSPEDFRMFVMRVRPPGEKWAQQADDPAVRGQNLLDGITAKVAQRAQLKTDPNYLARLKGYTTK